MDMNELNMNKYPDSKYVIQPKVFEENPIGRKVIKKVFKRKKKNDKKSK